MEERPPTLIKQLVNERFEPLEFLQHVFSFPIIVNEKQTSFIDLLLNTLNSNMKSRHQDPSDKYLYSPISELELYKLLAIKLIQGLETRGKTHHVGRGLYDEVQKYLGINRTKVFSCIYIIFHNITNKIIGNIWVLASW